MGSKSLLAGVEVPIIGSDSVKWIELTVPSPQDNDDDDDDNNNNNNEDNMIIPSISMSEDSCAASCSVVGNPPQYFIWRIHKSLPHTLELLQLSSHKEFPRVGLRITFPHALFPFAFVCQNQNQKEKQDHQSHLSPTPTNPYLLYALTLSGVAYLLKLRDLSAYFSFSAFPQDELMQFNLQTYINNAPITSVAATTGCLVVGCNDGSVACFQLGLLPSSAPGFMHQLRDGSGIGRLWGFMARGRLVGVVQDLVISEAYGLKLLFVLHSDGILRVWDLSCYSKILSHTISTPSSEGEKFARLWVGEINEDSSTIPMAILYRHTLEIRMEIINIYCLHCTLGDRINLSVECSMQNIPVEEGQCIDVKLTADKIWILKDSGLAFHNLFHSNIDVEDAHCYALQEEFVAEQLFQSSEISSDELLWITHSIFSSMKDQIVPFVASIFFRRLLHPGVHHSSVLRSTLMHYNRHWTDTEFQSLTVEGLKKEIHLLIEHEGASQSPTSIFSQWKNFCACYFHYWCKNNSPCGLLVQSSDGAVGLIRKNSVSLFRDLENIEHIIDGSSDELIDLVSFGSDLSNDESEKEILLEVLRCIISMSQQLGKPASAIFYETLVSTTVISSEEIVSHFLKILETGYTSSVSSLHISDLGSDFAWEKELADHKNLRKFSIDLLLSLQHLSKKATSWGKVLNIIESYLQFLVPRKVEKNFNAEMSLNMNTSILVLASSQIAKVMFDSALDILLFVNYLLNISGQINMLHGDISRIQLELVPMIQDIVSEWLIIHLLITTPSESPAIDDFSSQLSSLQIDNSSDKRSWNEKLGKCDFTLAFIPLLTIQTSSDDPSCLPLQRLPNPQDILSSVQDFTSWIIWGKTGVESTSFFRRSTELALTLLRHGQYDAVEHMLIIVEANSRREKASKSIQDNDGDWCVLHHLLGCCLLAQARCGFHGMLKERKVCEAITCFFRASSGQGASQALQNLSHDAGFPHLSFDGSVSSAAWKLHYYQWAMQIFEQYNLSEGAYQFALAALEQVDTLSQNDASSGKEIFNEPASNVKGRLWANAFKFALDLNDLHDAYCAILSNPDEESKYICLRRFIIVLYEQGAMKILCDGQLPFIGLAENIERELAWKAERSDIWAKPNPYKLLYAFEMHRHNWRRAASYIYEYSVRLRTEAVLKDRQHTSLVLQERLSGLSTAINALLLVHPAYAWIDPISEGNLLQNECYPCKKAKKLVKEQLSGSDIQPQRSQLYIDVEKLENEFVLTSAEYLLSLANVKWTFTEKSPSDLVDLLVQTDLYDMAFTVLLKFWKGSGLKRELEKVFAAMSLKCCPNKLDSSCTGMHCLLLTSSMEEISGHGSPDMGPTSQQSKWNVQWENLELYLKKYTAFHAGLPATVAETLLRTDPQIELPLWLVHMFKGSQRNRTWGMTGQESNPASLFRLYVDYGRYAEAINLLLEHTDSFVSVRPSDLINRKRPFAVWFPYMSVERIWCQLVEMINMGHMVDQCEKLKKLLHGALLSHLKQLKVDSEDVLSSAAC